jgi:hypothetical protein
MTWTPSSAFPGQTVRRVHPGIPRTRMIGCNVTGEFGPKRCWLQEEHAVPSSRRNFVVLVQRELTPIVDSDGEVHGGRQHRHLCLWERCETSLGRSR